VAVRRGGEAAVASSLPRVAGGEPTEEDRQTKDQHRGEDLEEDH
jgi:hypothetical protein